MRTKRIFEPQDIDMKDKVHSFLVTSIVIAMLSGAKDRENEKYPTPPDDPVWPFKRIVADILTHADEAGISITEAELPEVFRRG